MQRFSMLVILLLVATLGFADEEQNPMVHYDHQQEDWVFTGIAHAENGQAFGYYFLISRSPKVITSNASITDLKTNQEIFQYKQTQAFEQTNQKVNWNIGKGFIKYNPINDSWVFGVKGKQQGFNLRLEGFQTRDRVLEKNGNFNFYTLQSNRMNGTLVIDGKEHFVTAKHAWINHQWILKRSIDLDTTRFFCQFLNDSGLNLLKEKKKNKEIKSQATWLNEKGQSITVSQFAKVVKIGESWRLSFVTPKKVIEFKGNRHEIENGNERIDAGAILQGERGYCVAINEFFQAETKQ